jgi:hypothetical protein
MNIIDSVVNTAATINAAWDRVEPAVKAGQDIAGLFKYPQTITLPTISPASVTPTPTTPLLIDSEQDYTRPGTDAPAAQSRDIAPGGVSMWLIGALAVALYLIIRK